MSPQDFLLWLGWGLWLCIIVGTLFLLTHMLRGLYENWRDSRRKSNEILIIDMRNWPHTKMNPDPFFDTITEFRNDFR